MKKILFSTAAILALSLSPSRAGQLLLNGNFEAPAQTANGDHTGVNPTSWVVVAATAGDTTTAATTNTALDNLVRGTVTTGNGTGTIIVTPATQLPIDPNDTTPGAAQSFDGDGANVFIYQDFTLASTTSVNIRADFGGRDGNSGTGTGSFWQLLKMTGTNAYTAVATSATINPANNGTWVQTAVGTASLTAGTYRFAVSLGDPDQVDNATITTVVPEPSTYAEVGLGFVALLGWFGVKRRHIA